MKRTSRDCSILQNKKGNMNYIINYNSIPSLENIAIANLAIELCTQHDVKDEILQFLLQFDLRNKEIGSIIHIKGFKQLENRVIDKLFLLPLPNLLKEGVVNIIQPIELQVIDWVRQFKNGKFIDSICWTVEGCVNEVKTLEKLIAKYSEKYADILYPLACKFCLENHILYLYQKLPENIPSNYLSAKRFSEEYDNHLILYWTYFVKNKLSTLFDKINSNDYKSVYNSSHSMFKNMFSLAISENNSVAVKYFWKKLSEEEKSNVMQWVNIVLKYEMNTSYQTTNESANILFFILSQLNHDEQREVFKSNSYVILSTLFLYWPWQIFLLPTLHSMWEYLDENAYIKLLSLIVNEIREGKTTEKLFRNIWYNTPNNLKTCFVKKIIDDNWYGTDVLCKFLAAKDLETVKIILYNASVEEKNRIIFTLVRSEKFLNLIDDLNFLDTFMQNILTESDIFNLKTTFISAHGNTLCRIWICDDDWDMVETFFSWAFTSEDEINNFKNDILNKTRITYAILHEGNFELIDKFMSWCFKSKQDIEQFKEIFALQLSKLEVVMIGYTDWQLFEKVIKWCFRFDEDINKFKFKILESRDIIYNRIVYDYNFEFVDKVIKWCTRSDEECKQFKEEFVLSGTFLLILQHFVSNKVYDSKYSNWELTEKLMELFCPLKEEVIIKLKQNFETIDFEYHNMYYYPAIEEEDLLNMIFKYSKIENFLSKKVTE